MSILEEKWNLSQQAQEFFVYATLGIVPEWLFNQLNYEEYLPLKHDLKWDYKKYCTFMCAKAAYNDLCRTLEYKDEYKTTGKKVKVKESAINNICIDLVQAINKDGQTVSDSEKLFSVFFNDKKMDDQILKEYLKEYKSKDKELKNEQKFHFGQTQKWVNMTLKYLYLLGIVENPDNLHIPIDSYILKAMNQKNISIHNKVWSQFSYEDYIELYGLYEKEINEPYINWEHTAWIKQAEIEKGISE